jgi:hypothetical protein
VVTIEVSTWLNAAGDQTRKEMIRQLIDEEFQTTDYETVSVSASRPTDTGPTRGTITVDDIAFLDHVGTKAEKLLLDHAPNEAGVESVRTTPSAITIEGQLATDTERLPDSMDGPSVDHEQVFEHSRRRLSRCFGHEIPIDTVQHVAGEMRCDYRGKLPPTAPLVNTTSKHAAILYEPTVDWGAFYVT